MCSQTIAKMNRKVEETKLGVSFVKTIHIRVDIYDPEANLLLLLNFSP